MIANAIYSPGSKYIICTSYYAQYDPTRYHLQVSIHILSIFAYGCDMRNLHPDSDLSNFDREILRQYGAILD